MRTPTPEIRACFDARLKGFALSLGLDPLADIAWPNFGFALDADKLYLRPTCMFAETRTASLGPNGFERLQGVYQVDVFEVAGKGLSRAENMARSLVDEFRGGTELECCDVGVRVRSAYSGTPIINGGRLMIPVSVNWYCYTQK